MATSILQPKAITFQQYTGPPTARPRRALRLPAAIVQKDNCINSPAPAVDNTRSDEDLRISDRSQDQKQTTAEERESCPVEVVVISSDDDTDTDTESCPETDDWPTIDEQLKVLETDNIVVNLSTEKAADTSCDAVGSLIVNESAIREEQEVNTGSNNSDAKSSSGEPSEVKLNNTQQPKAGQGSTTPLPTSTKRVRFHSPEIENADSQTPWKRRKSSESQCVALPGEEEVDAYTNITNTMDCKDHRYLRGSEGGSREASAKTEGDPEQTSERGSGSETEHSTEAFTRESSLVYTSPRARRRRQRTNFKNKNILYPRNCPERCKQQAHCAEKQLSSSKNLWSSPVGTRLHSNSQIGSVEQDSPSSRCSVPKVTNLQIRVVSTGISFFAASLQTNGDVIASDRALELLRDVLGAAIKIEDISLQLLAAAQFSTWLLTGFLSQQGNANSSTAQSSTQLIHPAHTSDLQQRARALLRADSGGKEFTDTTNLEMSQSLDSDSCSDISTTYKPSTRRLNRAWKTLEEQRVLAWRKEGLDWNQIAAKLPGRSRGAIYLRWCTKLRHDEVKI